MAFKEGQFNVVELMVNDQFKTFSINLNAQHVNGMTSFDVTVRTYVRLLGSIFETSFPNGFEMVVNCKVSYDLLCAMDIMTEELFFATAAVVFWRNVKSYLCQKLMHKFRIMQQN